MQLTRCRAWALRRSVAAGEHRAAPAVCACMTDANDEAAEQLERALKQERQRLREIADETDAVDAEVNPPKPAPDHASDGGVF